MIVKDIRFAKEWDGRVRLRCEFAAEIPAVKGLSRKNDTQDGSYDVLLHINGQDCPVFLRIENIAAIDDIFAKAAAKVLSEQIAPLDLDFETGAHIKSFLEAEAYDMIEVWRGGS